MQRCSKCRTKVESGHNLSDSLFLCDICYSCRSPRQRAPRRVNKHILPPKKNKHKRPVVEAVAIPKADKNKYSRLGDKAEYAKEFCTKLTKEATKSEQIIKSLLQRFDIVFTFQMPIANQGSFYIVDFFIHRIKVCLEIDGGYHNEPEQMEKDRVRDKFLESRGLRVVRITNEQASRITGHQLKALMGYS